MAFTFNVRVSIRSLRSWRGVSAQGDACDQLWADTQTGSVLINVIKVLHGSSEPRPPCLVWEAELSPSCPLFPGARLYSTMLL